MLFGFARTDITPRVGVGLYGFGAFLNRKSTAVRAPLYARAMAVSDGQTCAIVVSCDLVGVSGDITERVREKVTAETGVAGQNICVHCTHTHSGPRTKYGIGQGDTDPPYLELLPNRIAAACIKAFEGLEPGVLHHATVPCVGLGYNREHDVRPALQDALCEDWRPAMPEITDTEAQVLSVHGDQGLRGFASYFSCHPVVGSESNTYISSDFCGVATDLLQREHGNAIGLYLQGCEGNINSCVVHHSEQDSLLALDVLAFRYARQVRPGISDGVPLNGDTVAALSRRYRLTRTPLPMELLRDKLAECEAILYADDADDSDPGWRKTVVTAMAVRKELARQERGEPFDDTVEVQALRIGDLAIVGAPFEIMHRYKRRIQAEFSTPVLVLSICNDSLGYAPEIESFDLEDNYAARTVPYMLGYPPLAPRVEDELVAAMTEMVRNVR
jgi:hypothetical protein